MDDFYVNRCNINKTSSLQVAVLRKNLLNYLKQQIAHAWIDESGNWVVHLWRDSVPRAKDGLGIGRARARDRSSVFGTDQARNGPTDVGVK